MIKKGFLLLILILAVTGYVFASTMPSDAKIHECADILGVPFVELKAFVNNYHNSSDTIEPDYVISGFNTLCSFFEESRNNSYAFTKKYDGKLIEFQGVLVKSVGGYANHFFLLIYEENFSERYYNFYAYIDPSAENKLDGISSGSRITVRGTLKMGMMFRLDKAVIVR